MIDKYCYNSDFGLVREILKKFITINVFFYLSSLIEVFT